MRVLGGPAERQHGLVFHQHQRIRSNAGDPFFVKTPLEPASRFVVHQRKREDLTGKLRTGTRPAWRRSQRDSFHRLRILRPLHSGMQNPGVVAARSLCGVSPPHDSLCHARLDRASRVFGFSSFVKITTLDPRVRKDDSNSYVRDRGAATPAGAGWSVIFDVGNRGSGMAEKTCYPLHRGRCVPVPLHQRVQHVARSRR